MGVFRLLHRDLGRHLGRREPAAHSFSSSAAAAIDVLEHLQSAGLSEDERAYRELARQFAAAELAPHAAAWDREGHFPVDTLRKAGDLGLGALFCRATAAASPHAASPASASEDEDEPRGYGTGLNRVAGAIIFEELATGCVSTAAYLSIHNMCAWMVDAFGNPLQRAAWLPRLASMDALASYCLTEPMSGSDAASLSTTARRDEATGDWVLNGSKAFISGAGTSDLYLVMCRTSGTSGGGSGGAGTISCLLVEKGTPGLSFGENEAKLGWRSQPTRAVFFDDVRVPAANLLGRQGEGFKMAMQGLDGGRLNIGACSLGAGAHALRLAAAYTTERRQFGRPLAANQALQFKLAEVATELHGARLCVRHAAALLDARRQPKRLDAEGKDPGAAGLGADSGSGALAKVATTAACAMAKVAATDAGFKACNEALQMHGGYGYLCAYPLERLVRDVRVHQILEGSNEVMKHIISRSMLPDLSK